MPIRSRLIFGSCFIFLAPALARCGGGGGSNDSASTEAQIQQLCTKLCNKLAGCEGISASECSTECSPSASSSSVTTTIPPGCDFNAFVSSIDSCLSQPCGSLTSTTVPPYLTCIEQVETNNTACTGTTSTGVTTSTGNSTSTGTTTGDAGVSCSICDKAGTCCQALEADAGVDCSFYSSTECNSSTDPLFATGCQDVLSAGQAEGIAQCM